MCFFSRGSDPDNFGVRFILWVKTGFVSFSVIGTGLGRSENPDPQPPCQKSNNFAESDRVGAALNPNHIGVN